MKWNLAEVSNLLTYGVENKLHGVNTPYCYFGSWKTMFAWHKEDLDLSAINYVHCGKEKFWYAVCSKDQHLLEEMARQNFPESFSKCHQNMRHKTTVINPYLLKRKYNNIRITKTCQKPGEFVVVFS